MIDSRTNFKWNLHGFEVELSRWVRRNYQTAPCLRGELRFCSIVYPSCTSSSDPIEVHLSSPKEIFKWFSSHTEGNTVLKRECSSRGRILFIVYAAAVGRPTRVAVMWSFLCDSRPRTAYTRVGSGSLSHFGHPRRCGSDRAHLFVVSHFVASLTGSLGKRCNVPNHWEHIYQRWLVDASLERSWPIFPVQSVPRLRKLQHCAINRLRNGAVSDITAVSLGLLNSFTFTLFDDVVHVLSTPCAASQQAFGICP